MLKKYPEYRISVLDALTYAGNTDNFEGLWSNPNFQFSRGGSRTRRSSTISPAMSTRSSTSPRSRTTTRAILNPAQACISNFNGVFTLLEAAKKFKHERFHQISTDEVYGSTSGIFREGDALEPNQPYSAAKAGGVNCWCARTTSPSASRRSLRAVRIPSGPYHYPEKLIPLMVTNAIEGKPLPVYGDGKQVRDWMYVEDHCKGVDIAFHHGTPGEVYNVGGGHERHNIDVLKSILTYLGKDESLIQYVPDRPGHDRRYSIDSSKMKALGFAPENTNFEEKLEETVRWYVENEAWWRKIKASDDYLAFTKKWYTDRK